MTVLLGRTSAGTSSDFVGDGHPTGWKLTASASGTLATIHAQFKVANAGLTSVELGVYTDGGTDPVTKLASASTSTGITGTAAFSVDVSASAVSINSGTVYWLALRGVGEQVDFQGNTSGTYREINANIALPGTWGGGSIGSGTIDIVIWGEDSGAGGGAVQELFTMLGIG